MQLHHVLDMHSYVTACIILAGEEIRSVHAATQSFAATLTLKTTPQMMHACMWLNLLYSFSMYCSMITASIYSHVDLCAPKNCCS